MLRCTWFAAVLVVAAGCGGNSSHSVEKVVGTVLCDRIICVCEASRASHTSRMRWAESRFVTVPNGVSEMRPSRSRAQLREALGLRPDECAVLSVGSLTRQKAYHRLIEAFAVVAARHAEAVLLIAGDGPLKDDLVRQARAAGQAEGSRRPTLDHWQSPGSALGLVETIP